MTCVSYVESLQPLGSEDPHLRSMVGHHQSVWVPAARPYSVLLQPKVLGPNLLYFPKLLVDLIIVFGIHLLVLLRLMEAAKVLEVVHNAKGVISGMQSLAQ
jgi:hypothetical protein